MSSKPLIRKDKGAAAKGDKAFYKSQSDGKWYACTVIGGDGDGGLNVQVGGAQKSVPKNQLSSRFTFNEETTKVGEQAKPKVAPTPKPAKDYKKEESGEQAKKEESGKYWFLPHSRESQGNLWFVKWFVPGFMNGCCIFISMWLLHVATYNYVHQMTSMDHALAPLSNGKAQEIIQDYGRLLDTLAQRFPFEALSLSTLDMVAAIFPGTFMLGVVFFDNLQLYTKIMFCNGLLALLKGTVDVMTILPDSAGWEACKERLTPNGVTFMQQNHTWTDLLIHEATGVNGKHLRWCSDMMISGHTYFTTIFALGLYELVRVVTPTRNRENGRAHCITVVLTMLVIFVAIGEQALEVYYVTVDRFHYTVDIYMALVLTLLIYTNVIPSLISKKWVSTRFHLCGKGDEQVNDLEKMANKRKDPVEDILFSQSDVLVPCCCPCILPEMMGRHHTYDEKHMQKLMAFVTSLVQSVELEGLVKAINTSRDAGRKSQEVWTGYIHDSDETRPVAQLIKDRQKENHYLDQARKRDMVGEGVWIGDISSLWSNKTQGQV